MGKSAGRRKGATLAEVMCLLGRLRAKGSYIEVAAEAHDDRNPGQAPTLVTGCREMGAPAAAIAWPVVEGALRRGWIDRAPIEGRLIMTAAGRTALKRSLTSLVAHRASLATAATSAPPSPVPARNEAESPLSWLRGRRDAGGRPLIEASQFEAGERLRADLTFAGLTPRVTMGWSGLPQSGSRGADAAGLGRDIPDNILAARARVTAALRAVGPEHAGILIDVCGHLRGLEDIAAAEGWPRRSARFLLGQALRALARHYGLERQVAVEETIATRLRHWGAEGYRPELKSPIPDPHPD